MLSTVETIMVSNEEPNTAEIYHKTKILRLKVLFALFFNIQCS